MGQYKVKKLNRPIDAGIRVPGSKSITNRALFISAFCDGKSLLKNVLFSDDTVAFIDSLEKLGIKTLIRGNTVSVNGTGGMIPKDHASINVESAGTAARFLTAALGLSHGTYMINASDQMKKRPMKPLFDALSHMGSFIEYTEAEDHLPVYIGAGDSLHSEVCVDSDISTQFLSALLLSAPLVTDKTGRDMVIHVEGTRAEGAYVRMTREVMKSFGVEVKAEQGGFRIPKGERYIPGEYNIEPDVSAACYFYAAAAVSGGRVTVEGVKKDSLQGDIRFLDVLERMGCSYEETGCGILLKGPEGGELSGIDVDMRDFSDQTMTLAAIAPFCSSPVTIRNVGHIRKQESDRISAICTELSKLGIKTEEYEDGLKIYPGEVSPGIVETYNDHRIAMAFSLTGLMAGGIVIDNYECCSKTFGDYFNVLENIYQNG